MRKARSKRLRRAVVGALFVALSNFAALAGSRELAGSAEAPEPSLRSELAPHPAIQDAIRRVARAGDEASLEAALSELRKISSPDFSDLVPQLALFLLVADGEREGMTPAVIVQRLGISKTQLARAIAPHRGTSNPALRAQLENLLGEDE